MQMKYSLATKQFKKRNNIFGQRKHQFIIHQTNEIDLQSIKELGEDLQDSTINHEQTIKTISINKANNKPINNRKISSVIVPQRDSKQRIKNPTEVKVGRHGLSPNTKPQIVVNLPPKSTLVNRVVRKELRLVSNVISFEYYCQQKQVQLAQMKQLMLKLYLVLTKNNERIKSLEHLVTFMQKNVTYFSKQLQFCLSHALRLDTKVDLFLNTMRSVYENLRISKLKQENLQLEIHQNSLQESKIKVKNRMKKQDKSLNQADLMSLLQYQSQISVVQQRQEKDKQTPIHYLKQRSTHHYDTVQINKPYRQTVFLQSSRQNTHQTFRRQENHFQKLSPFQANRLISNSSIKSFLYDSTYQRDTTREEKGKQPLRSNSNYSFESTEKQKIRLWIQKRGQIGMRCWLDNMGCLRRSNMTYMFWESGQVMQTKERVFKQLQQQGVIIRFGHQ